MRVDLEKVREIRAWINEINHPPLEALEIYDGGVKVDINVQALEDASFTGLTNFLLLEIGFWKDESLQDPRGYRIEEDD